MLTGEPAPHTLGDLVEDCRALLDDLGIETCVLAGMSVGGLTALEFALAYPERLQGLIVIAATSLAYTTQEREQYHREFDKLDVDGMVPRAFAEWVAPYCFGATTLAHNRELVDHWIERWATTVPARAVLHQFTLDFGIETSLSIGPLPRPEVLPPLVSTGRGLELSLNYSKPIP